MKARGHWFDLPGQIERGTIVTQVSNSPLWVVLALLTVFFFARSPDAPKTTITVLSLSSIDLVGQKKG
jgi:hypothetical protein